MDIILYLILSSILYVPQRGNISSDDVSILQKEDINVETLTPKWLRKMMYLRNDYRLTENSPSH